MLISKFVVGPVSTNCYLVTSDGTRASMVIDPDVRDEKEIKILLDTIENRDLDVKYIVNSHHHIDHTGGNKVIKNATGAEIVLHELDAGTIQEPWKWWQKMLDTYPERPCPVCGKVGISIEIFEEQGYGVADCRECGFRLKMISSPPADRLLHQKDVIRVGRSVFTVIHTPGHSPGGISLYAEADHILFTGDTLFKRSIGRTDMFDASYDDIIRSVKDLMKLPDETIVYPGHGEMTTIGDERRENQYVKANRDDPI